MADWSIGGSKGLPLDESSSWDGAAAAKAIFAAAGFDGDTPDGAKARKGFILYDPANSTKREGYHLPFATYKGGKLTAVLAGVRNAKSRAPQVSGISADLVKRAQAFCDSYLNKASKNKSDDWDGIVRVAVPIERVDAANYDDLLARAKERAPDPTIFDEAKPFFWRSRISNGKLDTYYTYMKPSTLTNYAAGAEEGVAVLDSHKSGGLFRSGTLGFGRSVRGQMTGSGEDRTVVADAYTIPGIRLDEGRMSEDYIAGIRSGIYRDVSVGFAGGQQICSICGLDQMASYECRHYPGLYYTTNEADGKGGERQLCTANIENAYLREYSIVYKGSTPGAGVVKAIQRAAVGELDWQVAREIEGVYGVRLAGASDFRIFNDSEPPEDEEPSPEEGDDDRKEPGPVPAAKQPEAGMEITEVRALLLPLKPDLAEGGEVDALRALLEELGTARSDRTRLEAEAKLGREYRDALIEEAVAEGVRANPDFPAESVKRMLVGQTVADIKVYRDHMAEAAKKVLPPGRQTTDDAGDDDKGEEEREPFGVPDRAYAMPGR